MIYFGTRLKDLRKSKRLTQLELAEAVDLVKVQYQHMRKV